MHKWNHFRQNGIVNESKKTTYSLCTPVSPYPKKKAKKQKPTGTKANSSDAITLFSVLLLYRSLWKTKQTLDTGHITKRFCDMNYCVEAILTVVFSFFFFFKQKKNTFSDHRKVWKKHNDRIDCRISCMSAYCIYRIKHTHTKKYSEDP